MMTGDFILLLFSTVGISLAHTLTGPDHYLPFIALSKSGKWTLPKTLFWTTLCGLAHVGTSLLVGLIGIFLGWTLSQQSNLVMTRGNFASWMLLGFGLIYTLWGLYNIKRNKLHKHFEVNDEADILVYEHKDGQVVYPDQKFKVTPWVMFFIFALGPAEPILPLLFYPSTSHSFLQVLILTVTYTGVTLFAMLLMVLLGYYGLQKFNFPNFEKYISFISGLVILLCGVGMVFLNW